MNCQATEALLLREMDGVLTESEHVALTGHLASCLACRKFQATLPQVSTAVLLDAESIRIPEIDQEWTAIHARLGSPSQPRSMPRKFRHTLLWWSAPLAAAAALALIFTASRYEPIESTPTAQLAVVATQVNYVESGDPNASTMVYVDKESGWLVVWASTSDISDQG